MARTQPTRGPRPAAGSSSTAGLTASSWRSLRLRSTNLGNINASARESARRSPSPPRGRVDWRRSGHPPDLAASRHVHPHRYRMQRLVGAETHRDRVLPRRTTQDPELCPSPRLMPSGSAGENTDRRAPMASQTGSNHLRSSRGNDGVVPWERLAPHLSARGHFVAGPMILSIAATLDAKPRLRLR